jgi:hypothetical protein
LLSQPKKDVISMVFDPEKSISARFPTDFLATAEQAMKRGRGRALLPVRPGAQDWSGDLLESLDRAARHDFTAHDPAAAGDFIEGDQAAGEYLAGVAHAAAPVRAGKPLPLQAKLCVA